MSKICLIYIFVIAFGFSVSADDLSTDTLKTKHLPEVIIKGRRFQNVRAALPIQQFDQIELKQLNATNVTDVAKHFSGVTVKDYGGIGGLKTVSLRGFGAQHTGVSYDGVMIGDIQTGQIDLGRFSLENIADISLTNAQPNDIFQSARTFASSGVICLATISHLSDSTRATVGKATLKTGSFGLLNGSLFLSKSTKKRWNFNLSGEGVVANGKYTFLQNIDPLNPNSIQQEQTRINSDVQSVRAEANALFRSSAKEFFSIKSNLYLSDRGLPGSVVLYNNYSESRLKDNQIFTQFHYQNRNSNLLHRQLFAKINHSESRFTNVNPSIQNEVATENYSQNEYYVSGSLLFRPVSQLSFSTAADGWYNELELNRSTGYERTNSCNRLTGLVNIAGKYTTERVTVGANVLYTHTQEDVAFGKSAANRDKFSPTLRFSVKVLKNDELRIRAFYKNIFRVPSFNELYYQDMGNKNLKPESTNQYNVGFVFHSTRCPIFSELELSIDGYYNQVDNKIIATPKDLFHWSMVNNGKVEIKGVDITALTSISFNKKSQLICRANYTYQKAVDALSSSENFGEQIPYTPFQSGSGSITWVHLGMECGYNLLYSGKRWDGENILANKLNPFAEHSLFASITKNKLKLTGELINLLNTQYEVVRFYPMPRRNFRITASYEF
ncbi:MAG: TonB-dependent receptor [Bacteroidales bacterium]|nr:TonB-dependent receptor [Bacteroidales bacterium]